MRAADALAVASLDQHMGLGSGLDKAAFRPVTTLELTAAHITPRTLVADYLYADVRTRIAAGGTGKTTIALYEAVILALGGALYGKACKKPLRTAIITREDPREILVARLREIIRALDLSPEDVRRVLENIRIIDLSDAPFRLSSVVDDVVMPHRMNIDSLIEQIVGFGPDWIIFDPLVSFGVGEARINDAEQGLIEAFRIIRNYLGCCVEGIHHSGKANARDKALDQYAGRGGSALSDGSRMVAVIQPLTFEEWAQETGSTLSANDQGLVMALPKLSYAPPQEPIYIRRNGYAFTHEQVVLRSREQVGNAVAEQVLQFIRHELEQGRKHTQNTLQDLRKDMNLSRDEVRAAVARLKSSGRVVTVGTAGKPGFHLTPFEASTPRAEAAQGQPQKMAEKQQ